MGWFSLWEVFHTEPFFHVHIVNCFENETGIVLDTGIYDGPRAKEMGNGQISERAAPIPFNGS